MNSLLRSLQSGIRLQNCITGRKGMAWHGRASGDRILEYTAPKGASKVPNSPNLPSLAPRKKLSRTIKVVYIEWNRTGTLLLHMGATKS